MFNCSVVVRQCTEKSERQVQTNCGLQELKTQMFCLLGTCLDHPATGSKTLVACPFPPPFFLGPMLKYAFNACMQLHICIAYWICSVYHKIMCLQYRGNRNTTCVKVPKTPFIWGENYHLGPNEFEFYPQSCEIRKSITSLFGFFSVELLYILQILIVNFSLNLGGKKVNK